MVCHDGSEASVAAFKQVRWDLMDDKLDQLVIAHIYDHEKNFDPNYPH
jgi:hypothetical protein